MQERINAKKELDNIIRLDTVSFQEILDGKTKLSTQCRDHWYKVGDVVSLIESDDSKWVEQCPNFANNCLTWVKAGMDAGYRVKYDEDTRTWVKAGDVEIVQQEDAIEECGKDRALCCKYKRVSLTGRELTIKLTEIITQNTMFVRFAFEVLRKKLTTTPYELIIAK